MNATVVDLFCGVGGLTHGFSKEGFSVIAGIDSDEKCRYAFEVNNRAKFIHKKIEDINAKEISGLFPEGSIKILIGCAPCQPFSLYTKRYTQKRVDDKWKLLTYFSKLINEVQPEIVSMENVPELIKFHNGKVFHDFLSNLIQNNYKVTHYIADCPSYGIPQKRKRLIVFASKSGEVKLLDPTHTPETYKTVRDTIGHLPYLDAGQICPVDPLHRSSKLSELNLKRIRQSIPGGTWRDWENGLVASCHTKRSGKSYSSVYGRMCWDEPSPTITTQCFGFGNGRFGHPEQNRALSLREAALLQTFPFEYEFVEPDGVWGIKQIGRHIGNAVPVSLGRIIAQSIRKHLENYVNTTSVFNDNQSECAQAFGNRTV